MSYLDAAAMDEAIELIQVLPAEDPLTVQLTKEFVAACLPWIVSVARSMRSKAREVPIQDLVQEGALAVQQRVRGFRTGHQAWPKYMQMVARNAMNLAIAKSGPVYLSDWSRRKFIRARRLASENGSSLSAELERQGLGEDSRRALEHGIGTAKPSEVVRDPDFAPPVNEVLEAQEQLVQVREFVTRLDIEHAEVIALAFGLDEDEEPRTDAEVGRVLRLPTARVAEMKRRGLDEIRAALAAAGD